MSHCESILDCAVKSAESVRTVTCVCECAECAKARYNERNKLIDELRRAHNDNMHGPGFCPFCPGKFYD